MSQKLEKPIETKNIYVIKADGNRYTVPWSGIYCQENLELAGLEHCFFHEDGTPIAREVSPIEKLLKVSKGKNY